MKDTSRGAELPSWLWLWFPPLIIVAQMAAKAHSEETYVSLMRSELGMVEVSTVLFLTIALITGIVLLTRKPAPHPHGFVPWMVVMLLGSLYFAGEEASWGQHYFGWSTPEKWAELNEQQETNFHNLGGLGDQAPRLLLSIAVFIGGIVLPLWLRGRGKHSALAHHPMAWIIPTIVVLPSAVIASFVTIPKGIFEALDRPQPYLLDFRPGETKEYAFGLFVMFYMLSLWLRRASLHLPLDSRAGASEVAAADRTTSRA